MTWTDAREENFLWVSVFSIEVGRKRAFATDIVYKKRIGKYTLFGR